MRIAYLAAGAAGMYCGSCLHDNTLAAALLKLGEEVLLTPIYTPIRTDEQDVSEPRVFIGGINAYLQQVFPPLRYAPRWLDRWLDRPGLLKALAGRGAAVDPAKLGAMTVSMLQGELGNQRKEVEYLADWLVDDVKPDVIHLSNAMMIGLARMIAQRGGPPVVCSLSGEDIFLEKLRPPYFEKSRQLLRQRAADVAGFVALNRYYANHMTEFMQLDEARVHVVYHGLELEGHGAPSQPLAGEPLRVGYLARICEDKGLHLLVEACEALRQRPGVPRLELHAAGYLGAADRRFFRQIEQRVAAGPLSDAFTYHGELSRPEKIEFLQSLHVFSTPTIYRESKGLPVLEAWANGVPAVLPDHGAFPEYVEATGGGLLHRPADPADLAKQLQQLLSDRSHAEGLGAAARTAIHDRFHSQAMAESTLAVYRDVLNRAA